MKQSTNRILMIKPSNFYFNYQTAEDNLYQNEPKLERDIIQERALKEFENLVNIIEGEGVKVEIFEDNGSPMTPDSIFPNNWFSTHDGTLVLYSMYAENRRFEVDKFKDKLKALYDPKETIDFTDAVDDNLFLEGTGAIVLDRVNRVAYSSLSQRSSIELFEDFCDLLGFKAVSFVSSHLGAEVYHTNVIMSITTDFAIIAMELVEEKYRKKLREELSKNHEIIELSGEQILQFAGNCLELQGKYGKILILSETAYESLTDTQVSKLEEKLKLVTADIDTIQRLGGGSVRCMIAEIF